MAYLTLATVSITTDASGDATAYTGVVNGYVHAIQYVPDGTAPYDATADVTITGETTGIAVTTLTNVAAALTTYPRAATHDQANAAALYAAAGTAVRDRVPIAAERIKLVIAQGGATKTGVWHVILG